MNINTKNYWNSRFSENSENSWKKMNGEQQTQIFAAEIAKRLKLSRNFSGTLLDFGCALGDAIPIYLSVYPKANIVGMDFSEKAIEVCKKKYGHLATFICGDINDVPFVDVIIASNVLEHLSDDKFIAKELLKKCSDLFIAVPFDEKLNDTNGGWRLADNEHINTYDKMSFNELNAKNEVFLCRGITLTDKLCSFINIEIKNILRPFFCKPKFYGSSVYRQILFHIKNKV